MNTKQKIVWIVYLILFVIVWYFEVTPPTNGSTAMGAIAQSVLYLIPAIILHKVLKGKK